MRLWKISVLVAAVLVGVSGLLVIYGGTLQTYSLELAHDLGYGNPIVRTLEVFRSRAETGSVVGGSADLLLSDMVKVPDTPVRFVFGNGDYGQMPGTGIGSDIGYVRGQFGMGLVGNALGLIVVLIPAATCRLALRLKAAIPGIPEGRRRETRRFIFWILVFGLVGHWKIFYLQTRVYAFVLFSVCFVVFEMRRLPKLPDPAGTAEIKPCT
jgi:hypothetical protein